MNQRLLLALLPLIGACGHPDEPAAEPVRPVRSVVAGESAGTVGATYSGVVQARHESPLGFQTGGKIVARLVEVGQHVRRGQPLLRLDPAQQVLQVTASTASVDAARSRVAQLRIDVQRTEQLLARQFASQAELDQQRLALAEAESQLRSAVARQQIDVNQRGFTELVADRDGVVSAINAEAGQVVSPGQVIVTLAGDGEREVLVSIAESRVDELRRAKHLQISLWAQPGKVYAGTLRELAPDADRVSRTYSARVAVKDADAALMLGMTASVSAPDVEGTHAIRLPLTAIYNKDGQPLVWIVDPTSSRVATRPVQLGAAQNDAVLIAAGLRGGETVVTAGVNLLHDGQAVRPLNANGVQP
ncbi:MAG: efflux RND transporter periplasmic adaptor subunit [Piscinibacter sp.]|nr:efflux RND transporter periplasmic adaptor subunit [Piscinibacter sp.]